MVIAKQETRESSIKKARNAEICKMPTVRAQFAPQCVSGHEVVGRAPSPPFCCYLRMFDALVIKKCGPRSPIKGVDFKVAARN